VTAAQNPPPAALPMVDLLVLAVATLAFALVSAATDLSGSFAAWALAHEEYNLDELPLIMIFLAVAMAWFSWRRMMEARAEISRRLRAEAILKQTLEQNRRLAQAHVRVQEDERRHLARELHDELGQCVNAIKIEAVGLRSGAADDIARYSAGSIVELADRIQLATRDIMRRLRPPGIDEFGLVAVLENYVDEWRRRLPRARFTLRTPEGEDPGLGETVNIAVYRLVQEALTNVARHSDPRHVDIDLARRRPEEGDGDELALTVRNDGVKENKDPASRQGIGLIGMRERVEALGGWLYAGFRPGSEFLLEARLPIELDLAEVSVPIRTAVGVEAEATP